MKIRNIILKAFIIPALLILLSYNSFAQENIIKVSPVVFLKGQLVMVHYERALNENISLGIGAAPIIFPPIVLSSSADSTDVTNAIGIAIDPEFRFYTKDIFEGLFVGVYGSVRVSSWEYPPINYSFKYLSDITNDPNNPDALSTDSYRRQKKVFIGGFQLGTEKVFDSGLVLDLYFGLGVKSKTKVTKNERTGNKFDETPTLGLATRGNFAIGYRF